MTKRYVKLRDFDKPLIDPYECKGKDYFTNDVSMQEILMSKYIKKTDFPFVQKIVDYELKLYSCKMFFEKIDTDKLFKCRSDVKFICYVVIKFILVMYYDHQINHNDLSMRNIMFNHKSHYSFSTYDSFELPEYVPVVIDFELSQRFTEDNKILINYELDYYREYNIKDKINPIYQDLYKFLKTFMDDLKGREISNKDYVKEIYDKIFKSEVIIKDCDYLILDLDRIDESIKIKEMGKDELLKYLFND